MKTLEEICGGTLPPGLAALSPDQREQLALTIETARKQQSADLREALARGFDLIPRILRAPIKKLILG